MNKKLFIGCAALFLLLQLTCFAQPVPVKRPSIKGNPKDSVLVYGNIYSTQQVIFTQLDGKFEPDCNTAVHRYDHPLFFLNPVTPGTYYRVQFIKAYDSLSEVYPYVSMDVSLFDFRVPSKPGLYYWGSVDPMATIRNKKLTDKKHVIQVAPELDKLKKELQALQELLLYAQNTEWEPLVQERIDEVSKEIKNVKNVKK